MLLLLQELCSANDLLNELIVIGMDNDISTVL